MEVCKKYAEVIEIDFEKALARVEIVEQGLQSYWLPWVNKSTGAVKSYYPLEVGQQVVCFFDKNLEQGVIVGALYNDVDTPPEGSGEGKYIIDFGDGSIKLAWDNEAKSFEAVYDTVEVKINSDELSLKKGDTEIKITDAGITFKKGSETLKKIITDLITATKAETHTTGTGPSGPPINIADYIAVEQRLPSLFEE